MDDKQARSVFVGNIPHGTTEEQMKDIFAVVGSVLSFRIVYDRETGNPKGYGFAEYQDVETAQSAIRNLNGFEFGGRTLRVDKASSQADELRMVQQQNQLTTGPPLTENYYGPPVDPRRAPEVISQAVASLPPEQMFELMKQLKTCIQNNPSQARQMLLHNPQLAYALLQAQVVMRIVEPQVAVALLYRQDPSLITPLQPVVPSNTTNLPFVHPPMPSAQHLSHVVGPMPPVSMPFPSPPIPPPNHSNPSLMFPSSIPSQLNIVDQNQQSLPALDQERANLMMQVIQLSDSQIAMLPPDQRHNILMLKEQIVNSGAQPGAMQTNR